jgi:hypothetical protein
MVDLTYTKVLVFGFHPSLNGRGGTAVSRRDDGRYVVELNPGADGKRHMTQVFAACHLTQVKLCYVVVLCSVLCCVVLCYVVLCCAVCCVVLRRVVLCCVVCCVVLCCVVLCCVVLPVLCCLVLSCLVVSYLVWKNFLALE